MITLGVIPARFASTRFIGKPLANIAGKPMIQHVYERCRQSLLDEIIVATDDKKIFDVVQSFGGDVVMTNPNHQNGTARVAEIAKEKVNADIVVNIQGDEPLIDPMLINDIIEACKNIKTMVSVRKKITNDNDYLDSHVVKVVCDVRNHALYFSRAPIPFDKKNAFKHIGLYAFRREFLLTYVSLPISSLEQCEGLEQLRALENGYAIHMIETSKEFQSVDIPNDIFRVQKILGAVCEH